MCSILSKITALVVVLFCSFLILVIRGDFPGIRQKLSEYLLFSSLIAQRDAIIRQVKTTQLNQAICPPEYLAALLKNPLRIKPSMITGYNGYLQYYRKILEYFPRDAQAHALLGFSYYHLGDYPQSIFYYKKALMLDPSFFWNYYNLGVIYLKIKQYRKAAVFFKAAFKASAQKTLETIYKAKTYQQIRYAAHNFQYQPQQSLRKGYQNCQRFLVAISAFYQGKQTDIFSEPALRNIYPLVF